MHPIIDAHSHLGDILYPGGGSLMGRRGVRKERVFDPITIAERSLHRDFLGLSKVAYRSMRRWVTRAERARNRTATVENFRGSMNESGITYSICLPLPPHVTFADLKEFTDRDPGILPFTGVDYSTAEDPGPRLAADVKAGARGLKLHPIIQKVALSSDETRAAVATFTAHGLPVLFHCGISSYYLGRERIREQTRYGEIRYARELVNAFPSLRFVAGHSGLFEVSDVIEMLSGCSNVWVDTSFQSVATVRKLIATFGPERVLFGSDWPFGNRQPAVAIVKAACRGDRRIERRIFFENAAKLLGMG